MTSLGTIAGGDQASRLRSLVRALRSEPAPSEFVPVAEPEIASQAACVRAVESPAPTRPKSAVIAIASGKGGVGKTVVAVNLAIVLARRRSVTLIDADLGAANADIMLGVRATRRLDAALATERPLRDLLTQTEHGIHLVAGAVGTRRMVERPDTLYRRLSELDGTSDLIVIDLPAGLDPMVIETCAQADLTLIVTTPEPTAIADAYATIKAVTARRSASECTPRQRLEVVMNQAPSDAIGERAHQRLATVAQRFLARRVTLAGSLAVDGGVVRSILTRTPIVSGPGTSPWVDRLESLAVRVVDGLGAMDAPVFGV